MSALLTKSGDTEVVTLSGDLTLEAAPEVKAALVKALLDGENVSINIENVEKVDMSCMQLLCSTHRTAMRLNKHVVFGPDLPKIFCDMIASAGFKRSTGCKLDKDKSCLWASCEKRRTE